MIDKEKVIIDDVNVGQCKYLNEISDCDGYHYYCDLADDIKNEYCEHYKDCYFKQKIRKEQECEILKEEKAEIKKYLGISSKTILERLVELQERRVELSEKNISYEQALDEIVGIIKKLKKEDILTFPDFSREENYKMIMGQCNSGYIEILDIINKTKDGNNEQF